MLFAWKGTEDERDWGTHAEGGRQASEIGGHTLKEVVKRLRLGDTR